MAGKFTVHAFGVAALDNSEDLEVTLKTILGDDLEQRNRRIAGADIRVEDIKKTGGVWLLDFAKLRYIHGPGKGSKSKAVQGFSFEGDETFCEETAVMYIPSTKHLLVQYNHYGVRYSAIEEYFSKYIESENNIYEFSPKYDADTERLYEQRTLTKKLVLSIDPRHLSAADRKAGTAVAEAINIGDKSNAGAVELTISAGAGKKGKLTEYIDRTIALARKLYEDNPDSVSKIKASVSIDHKVKVLDLITQRLKLDFGDLPVGEDKRWARTDRYRGLERAKKGWIKVLK